MSYATVAEIQQSFPSALWDPSKNEPLTATVESWIADWSAALDGQLAGAVLTPVDATKSPDLHALCSQITRLRVRADVYDVRYPPGKDEQAVTRQSQVWRKQADALVAGILAGGIGDGVAAGATTAAPVGSFGGVSGKVRDKQW